MRLDEHDPEYGAITLNIDDFEVRQQRKFSRKLSRLSQNAVLFFAKLKLKAQAKSRHWDDNDIRWELNAVEGKMNPRVRRRYSQMDFKDSRWTKFMDNFAFAIHKPIGLKEQKDDYEQTEDFAALYRVTLEKLKHPIKRDEFYLLVGAFVYKLQDNGLTQARAREVLADLLYDAAKAQQELAEAEDEPAREM